MLRPVAVELEPVLDIVRVGLRQSRLDHEFEESLLQPRAGEAGGFVEGDRAAQSLVAVMAHSSRQKVFDGPQVEDLLFFRALYQLLQPVEANGRSQIQQRPRYRGDGNAFPRC